MSGKVVDLLIDEFFEVHLILSDNLCLQLYIFKLILTQATQSTPKRRITLIIDEYEQTVNAPHQALFDMAKFLKFSSSLKRTRTLSSSSSSIKSDPEREIKVEASPKNYRWILIWILCYSIKKCSFRFENKLFFCSKLLLNVWSHCTTWINFLSYFSLHLALPEIPFYTRLPVFSQLAWYWLKCYVEVIKIIAV